MLGVTVLRRSGRVRREDGFGDEDEHVRRVESVLNLP
jgi:hypothetical protein